MSLLVPSHRFREVAEITVEFLNDNDIAGVLIDIDNTIVPWRGENPSETTREWFKKVKEAGLSVALFSNAGGPRAARMSKQLGIPVVAPARKPLKSGYKRGLIMLKLDGDKVAAIGDQIFMDVLGGNRAGLTTILVEPVSQREFAGTRLLRQIEKMVRKPL